MSFASAEQLQKASKSLPDTWELVEDDDDKRLYRIVSNVAYTHDEEGGRSPVELALVWQVLGYHCVIETNYTENRHILEFRDALLAAGVSEVLVLDY